MAAAGNMVHCQLWMGGLEPYMTESFILASFQRMGEKPLNVKVMRNKFTGEQAGYCFVHFENDEEAIDAMHKLNGKIIPNTNPSVRFRLNTATNQGKIMMNEREFSLWVGDLTPEVDDYTLYKTFAAKYTSIKAAKDASGYSKGFGFLRFGSEEEQKHCLIHMNGYKGLGLKPLKISNAIPKAQRAGATNGSSTTSPPSASSYHYTDYTQFYDPNSYWQNYSQWGGYGYDPNTGGYNYDASTYAQQYSQYQQQYNQAQYQQYSQQYSQYYQQQQQQQQSAAAAAAVNVQPMAASGAAVASASQNPSAVQAAVSAQGAVSEESEIVEHTRPLDVDKENLELAEPLINFWTHTSLVSNEFNVAMSNEFDKLNFVEVNIPPIKKKLENCEEAKKIVLSHTCEMTFEDWEKRFEEKQKLLGKKDEDSTSSSSSEESQDEEKKGSEDKTKDAEGKKQVSEEKSEEESPKPSEESQEPAAEVEPAKKRKNEEPDAEKDSDSPTEKKAKLADDPAPTEEIPSTEPNLVVPSRTISDDDRARLFAVMADVDVDAFMAETEFVSSEATSESEGGSAGSSGSEAEDEAIKQETAPSHEPSGDAKETEETGEASCKDPGDKDEAVS